MHYLVPANKAEKETVEALQQTTNQVANLMLGELRKADMVRGLCNRLIEIIVDELKDYRDGSDVRTILQGALAELYQAERLIRARGETNGHR